MSTPRTRIGRSRSGTGAFGDDTSRNSTPTSVRIGQSRNVDRCPTCHTMAHLMRLLLPGERRFSWLEVGLAIVIVLGLCALGCAAPRAHTRGVTPSLFQA